MINDGLFETTKARTAKKAAKPEEVPAAVCQQCWRLKAHHSIQQRRGCAAEQGSGR